MWLHIRDRNGGIVSSSRDSRGIRRYVSNNRIKVLAIDRLQDNQGKLLILFENGSSYEENWCSFFLLCDSLRRWRNVYGSPLRVNGEDKGKVGKDNPPDIASVEEIVADIVCSVRKDRGKGIEFMVEDFELMWWYPGGDPETIAKMVSEEFSVQCVYSEDGDCYLIYSDQLRTFPFQATLITPDKELVKRYIIATPERR